MCVKLLFPLLFLAFTTSAQQFTFSQSKNFGTSGSDLFHGAIRLADGSTIFAAEISTADHDHPGIMYGGIDYWIVKTDASNNIIWEKTFGGIGDDVPYAILMNSNNDVLVAGISSSGVTGSKTTPSYGSSDIWMLKLDTDGNQLGEYIFGTSETESWVDLKHGRNNELLVAGISNGTDSSKTSPFYGGTGDAWLLKIDQNGSIIDDISLGGTGNEISVSIAFDGADNIIAGINSSSPVSGNKTSAQYGAHDDWFVSLNYSFDILGQLTYGGSDEEYQSAAGCFFNGYYYTCLTSASAISGNRTVVHYASVDAITLKINLADLSVTKQFSYYNQAGPSAMTDLYIFDNQIVITGSAFTYNPDFSAAGDISVRGVDYNLDPVWYETIGGTGSDGSTVADLFWSPGKLEVYGVFKSPSYTGNLNCPSYGSFDIIHYTYQTDLHLEENQALKLSAWPNPVQNILSVSGLSAPQRYTITDITGKIIRSGETFSEINVEGLGSGSYLLRFTDQVIRFTKE